MDSAVDSVENIIWTRVIELCGKIQRFSIQWFLILFHWVTEYVENTINYLKVISNTLYDIHKEEKWIFLDPNSLPLKVRGEYTGYSYARYIPDEYRFTNENDGGRPRRFHVVTAEIQKPDEATVDVTEIFHRVTWSPGAEPTLFEMVLLHGLHGKTPYSTRVLKDWKLVILDDNCDEHRIELKSELAMKKFRGWRQ